MLASVACPRKGKTMEREPDATTAPDLPETEPVEGRGARLRRHGHRGGLYASAFVVVALLVIVVALVIANTRQVRVSWVVGKSHASLVWLIVATAILGWLLGLATSIVFRLRTRRRRPS
jgi:uncharacterized integral membrane protein